MFPVTLSDINSSSVTGSSTRAAVGLMEESETVFLLLLLPAEEDMRIVSTLVLRFSWKRPPRSALLEEYWLQVTTLQVHT